jgi:hypothetical protein
VMNTACPLNLVTVASAEYERSVTGRRAYRGRQ